MVIMSWKRIFRTARKVGAPVIIANEDGKKPQVVLPLDIYEALIDEDMGYEDEDFDIDFDDDEIPEFVDFDDDFEDIPELQFEDGIAKYGGEGEDMVSVGKNKPKTGLSEENSRVIYPDETAAAAFETDMDFDKEMGEPMDISKNKEYPDMGDETFAGESQQEKLSKQSEDIDLEDRFYFEPIDDEADKP